MTNRDQWDGWPHRVDGWVYVVKPWVKCAQLIKDDQRDREERLEMYRRLASSEQPLFRD